MSPLPLAPEEGRVLEPAGEQPSFTTGESKARHVSGCGRRGWQDGHPPPPARTRRTERTRPWTAHTREHSLTSECQTVRQEGTSGLRLSPRPGAGEGPFTGSFMNTTGKLRSARRRVRRPRGPTEGKEGLTIPNLFSKRAALLEGLMLRG